MILGQRGAKKHTEQRASEDAHEHDETDCRGTHDPVLMAIAASQIVAPGPSKSRRQATRAATTAAATLAARLALTEAGAPCHALLVRRFHGLHGIGPGLGAHFVTRTRPVVVSMWMTQKADTSSRLTVATRPVPGAKR